MECGSQVSITYDYQNKSTSEISLNSDPLHGTNWVKQQCEDGRIYYYNIETLQSTWDIPIEVSKAGQKQEKKEESDLNNSAPIRAESIPGSNWLMVQSSDGRIFYFNPINKTSIWNRPVEFIENPIVDDMEQKFNLLYEEFHVSKEPKNSESPHEENDVATYQTENDLSNPTFDAEFSASLDLIRQTPYESRKELFCELLRERRISSFSMWDSACLLLKSDPRFYGLNAKDRKQCFNDFLRLTAEDEREKFKLQHQEHIDTFKSFLKRIFKHKKMSYTEFKMKYADNENFSLVSKNSEREAIFNECLEEFFEVDARKEQSSKPKEPRDVLDFFEMLDEIKDRFDMTKASWEDIKREMDWDSRYKAIRASHVRRHLFRRYVKERIKTDEQNEIDDRVAKSLKDRELEVREERRRLERQRLRDQSFHLHETSVDNFNALLGDLITYPKLSWKEAKGILQNDSRYDIICGESALSRDERHDLFEKHIENINAKQKKLMQLIFGDYVNSLEVKWRDIRHSVKEDARFSKIAYSSSQVKEEFEKYMEYRIESAKKDLNSLLIETKMIDHKLKGKIKANPNLQNDLIDVLSKDKRYLMLDFMSSEREEIIQSFLQEMERRGTPPPPTASNPTSRFR